MTQEQLIYKINKIEYLLFEVSITSQEDLKEAIGEAEKFGGFMQGVKDIKPGFFSGSAIARLLVPTNKAKEFSKQI